SEARAPAWPCRKPSITRCMAHCRRSATKMPRAGSPTRRWSKSPSHTDGGPVRSPIFGLLASASVFGLPSMPAHAGSFSISPIRLDLSAGAKTAALTVRNDAQEVLVQAEMMLWEQVDGEDRLTPTRDLLVSPAVFTLPPNGSQLVRVALRHVPADVTRELAYRLILQ